MEISKNKRLGIISIAVFSILLIFSILFNTQNVSAGGIGEGIGGAPSTSGVGTWYHTNDPNFNEATNYGTKNTTQAWKDFVAYQVKIGRARSESGMVSLLNNYVNGKGFALPGGGHEELYLSCMKSQYIWYYGDQGNKMRWLLEAGLNTANPPINMKTTDMINAWEDYKALPNSQWGKRPGPVIVCSGTFLKRETKPEIVLKARSGTFIYNGEVHTVRGWDLISGQLKKGAGHSFNVEAQGSRREVGQTKDGVKFLKQGIVNSSGVDVSSQYRIRTIPGTIKVVPITETNDYFQCVYSGSDSVSNIITRNHLRIDPVDIDGTISSVVGDNGQIYVSHATDADELMTVSSMPDVAAPKSSWTSWKSSVTAVGNQRHIDIDLNEIFKGSASFGELFSKYGGVLDVRINHSKEGASVTFCQPQTRTSEEVPVYTKDSEGNEVYSHSYTKYSPWENAGEELIETISNPTAEAPERSSYQILGVNCNAPGFLTVRNSISSEIDKSSLIEATGSGYIKTKRKPLTSDGTQDHLSRNFILGYSGPSSQSSFYTDGPTCKENGLCIVTPGPNGSPNDSHNNTPASYQSSNALFAHMSDEYASLTPSRFGFPNDKGTSALNDDEIVFFRDNEERTVRADVWRMKDSSRGWIATGSQAADRTVVNLFEGATPEYDITTVKIEGQEDSNKLKIGRTTLDDTVNKFVFKSQWASIEGKPYKLGANWVYQIGAQRGIVNVIAADSVSTGEETDYIEVACQFKNESTAQNAQINQNPFVRPSLSDNSLRFEASKSVKVLFSRGVSDKRDSDND